MFFIKSWKMTKNVAIIQDSPNFYNHLIVLIPYKVYTLKGSNDEIFVDRHEELAWLERQYSLFLRGVTTGVLVYGIRRVGKTTLIDRFLQNREHLKVVCAGISNSRGFFLEILEVAERKFGIREEKIYWEGWLRKDNPEKVIFKQALSFLNSMSELMRKRYIVFLDEVHLMLDRIAKKVAREENTNVERALLDLFWIFKGCAEEKKVFWILTTSVGWEKLREIMQLKHKEGPLLAVFERYEVKPLSEASTIELILKVNPEIPYELAETLARISGGIPKIAIVLATNAKKGDTGIGVAMRTIRMGAFDDIFDNLVRFVADLTRFSYNLIMHVIANLSGGFITTSQIADRIGMSQSLTNAILNELVKIGIIRKSSGKPTRFYIAYPLLASWAVMRIKDIPLMDKIERAIAELGLTAESYIRELIMAYRGKVLKLRDDRKGSLLAGTAQKLELCIEKVLSKKQTDELFGRIKIKNADIIIKSDNQVAIVEVIAGIRNLTEKDIDKIAMISEEIKHKLNVAIKPIIVYYSEGKIEPTAIASAVRKGITIVTKGGIRKIAKQIGLPTL